MASCISFRKWSGKVLLLTTLLVLFVQGVFSWGSKAQPQRVLLSDIDTLTVYADRNTAYRRTVSALFPGKRVNCRNHSRS